jgi:hypothetical protein
MNVIITYKEISDFIEQKFKIRPTFSSVNKNILKVSYKPMAFMPSIDIKFVIDEISDDSVSISYDCGAAAALMIAGVVTYLNENIPNGVDVNTTNRKVKIYPQQIEQVEKALEYVALSDITFDENNINIALLLI